MSKTVIETLVGALKGLEELAARSLDGATVSGEAELLDLETLREIVVRSEGAKSQIAAIHRVLDEILIRRSVASAIEETKSDPVVRLLLAEHQRWTSAERFQTAAAPTGELVWRLMAKAYGVETSSAETSSVSSWILEGFQAPLLRLVAAAFVTDRSLYHLRYSLVLTSSGQEFADTLKIGPRTLRAARKNIQELLEARVGTHPASRAAMLYVSEHPRSSMARLQAHFRTIGLNFVAGSIEKKLTDLLRRPDGGDVYELTPVAAAFAQTWRSRGVR